MRSDSICCSILTGGRLCAELVSCLCLPVFVCSKWLRLVLLTYKASSEMFVSELYSRLCLHEKVAMQTATDIDDELVILHGKDEVT